MQKSRIVVSSLVVGTLIATAYAQDRAPRSEKVQGVSFHAVSTAPASGYNQATYDGQTYFVAPQALIRSDQVNSVQSGASSLTLAGDFSTASKANQVGVLIDGQLAAVGSLTLQKGQATINGLTAAQTQRVSGLLSRRGSSPTSSSFTVVPAGQSNGEFVYDVYVQNVPGLRTYQVKLDVSGGTAGSLTMTDVRIDENRQDYVFFGNEAIKAADHSGSRLGGTLFSGSVDVTSPLYLGSWRFRPSPDAAGTFSINVRTGAESFVADGANQNLPIGAVGATVDVGRKSPRAND